MRVALRCPWPVLAALRHYAWSRTPCLALSGLGILLGSVLGAFALMGTVAWYALPSFSGCWRLTASVGVCADLLLDSPVVPVGYGGHYGPVGGCCGDAAGL